MNWGRGRLRKVRTAEPIGWSVLSSGDRKGLGLAMMLNPRTLERSDLVSGRAAADSVVKGIFFWN